MYGHGREPPAARLSSGGSGGSGDFGGAGGGVDTAARIAIRRAPRGGSVFFTLLPAPARPGLVPVAALCQLGLPEPPVGLDDGEDGRVVDGRAPRL